MRYFIFIIFIFVLSTNCQWLNVNPGGDQEYSSGLNALPPGRVDGALWCYGNDVYLYGGAGIDGDVINDMWRYESDTGRWFWQQAPPKELMARKQMASWTLNGKFWLYGGKNESNYIFNDLWSYDISTREWTLTSKHVDLYDMIYWSDVKTDTLYMQGGMKTSTSPSYVLHSFDINTMQWGTVTYNGTAPVTGVASIGVNLDKVYVYSAVVYVYEAVAVVPVF